MKTKRCAVFLLVFLVLAGRVAFDCGCAYAAPGVVSRVSEAAMPCHSGAHEKSSSKQACCSGCQAAHHALSPKSVEIQTADDRRFLLNLPVMDFMKAVESRFSLNHNTLRGPPDFLGVAPEPLRVPLYLSLQTLLI